jgi:RNA polymerase sigma factor (sigma-70 family)
MATAKNADSFPTTQWTRMEKLRSPDAETAQEALNDLCACYHFPLYCLIRKNGLNHHDAQDVLHEFLAKLLRLEAFHDLAAENGRLRTFLAKSLKRFVLTWLKSSQRRMNREILAEDAPFHLDGNLNQRYIENVADLRDSPDAIFDMQWCSALLGRVLKRLEEDYRTREKAALFAALKPVLLSGGSLREHDTAQIAEKLSMQEPAVRTALLRLLRGYRKLLTEEVRQTVDSEAEMKEEIHHLLRRMKSG